MTRRTFLQAAAAASMPGRPVLCIFSKHMAQFGYDELGKKAKEIGFDGVDLTVRAGGHVVPERAAEDMPRAIEAIRGHGLAVPMITTGIVAASAPEARPTLSTAARLKVGYWKPGYLRYNMKDIEASVEEARRAAAGLAGLSKEYGVQAGFHNHSGTYIGSAVWDIRYIIQDLDPKWVGYYFDPAHATIEGGLAGWQIAQKMVLPRLKMVALKDFYWNKKADGKWEAKWCPLGQGMVNWREIFRAFAEAKFTGPITLHVEYEPADELAAIAKDFEFMKKQVAEAYP
jgi:L-ribulose-5-phosphate 3-epimerase